MTGGPGGELEIFDLTVLNQVAAVPGHAAQVNCMVAGPEESNIFFSGSADRCVILSSSPPDGCHASRCGYCGVLLRTIRAWTWAS